MRPEQLRRRADSPPRGAASTGPPQGSIQTARPVFFSCRLLPRVHAADATAGQPAQTRSSSTLPANIRKPELLDTGWGRIRDLFDKNDSQSYPEEVTNVFKYGIVSATAGFFYGGLPAARYARQRYIQVSQAEVYTSRVDAVRSAHNAAIRAFVRYGWRWSWRVSLIVTLFSSVSTGLSVYRDKDALSNYVAAGAATVGLFRLNLGLRGLVAGSVIGAVLGIPVGALVISLHSLTGETSRQRRRREQRELYEHKLAEWTARLEMTDELISSLNDASQEEEIHRDVQKIQELLSLPKNPEEEAASTAEGGT
ncbi:Complex I assembly factor TIMMDC1, mitochondrial [Oryzias melastigma]|uniref:Complex I assembly factor TIMMDC1, mitochondrial n=1 Tax=Oryzias melastigma TaxID=30732 RepID=A0A3B3CZY0_ORYME|nr:complex I assembly factor TIMMDC1, mitochondrial [Oryzias melastigma]KAF6719216.1 Complex I assembly factor TIMMDC1, mitochondrial [Oryzias melastigma]